MKTKLSQSLAFGAIACAATMLVACGGGGGSDSGGGGGTGPTPASVSGKAVDFYLSGATVTFLDCGNQTVTTNASGDFTFPANCSKSALKVAGGTDIGTRLPFSGVLQSPAVDYKAGVTPVASPLTTLVAQLGPAQAAVLANKLGLGGKDLLNLDPMRDAGALKAAVVVQQLVNQISRSLAGLAAGAGGSLSAEAAAAAAANAVANVVGNASGVVDFTDPATLTATVSAAVKASVQNAKSSLPASLQSNIGAVSDNLAALAGPLIGAQVSAINTALGTITLGADPTATLDAITQSGGLSKVVASESSQLVNKLVSAIAPAAFGDASMSTRLAALGAAVATGSAQDVLNAANDLGGAVNGGLISDVVAAVTLSDYVQLGNVSLNGGAPMPLADNMSVSGGRLDDVAMIITKQGAPFGSGASEVRAGMRYAFNGNTVEVVIERIVLGFTGNALSSVSIPPGAGMSFRITGSVNASGAFSNGDNDSLFANVGTGAMRLPFNTVFRKVQGTGLLTSAQILALTPSANSTVNATFAVAGTSGNEVKAGIGSGAQAVRLPTASVDTGAKTVGGDGVKFAIAIQP